MPEQRQTTRLKAALIIPALDEEEVIGSTLRSIPPDLFHLVVVADNGSTDRTGEIARAEGAMVVSEPERGYGAACLKAIAALPPEIGAVAFMQADGSEDPHEAALLLDPIDAGRADMVIGSRVLGEAEPGALEPHQRFGNWLATALVRLVYRHRYTDLGPFRAIRRDCLDRLQMRDRNYGWTIEMQIRALQHHLRVIEVPVSYGNRRAGQGKVSASLKASVQAGIKIIGMVFTLALDPPSR
jgi:glycosyltransferase involved in cell wall biosynthesis